MNQDEWDQLVGHLRNELVAQSRDPGVYLRDSFEEHEIWIRNDSNEEGEWLSFDMESEYDNRGLRRTAVSMVRVALGSD